MRALRVAAVVGAAATLMLVAAGSAGARSETDIAAVRAATTQFKNAAAAQAAGYGRLVDAAGIACIDSPVGGMGIHYVNADLVADPTLEPTRPEVLVYQPDEHGKLQLVAVE
ncbi:MAG TPA: hypothetical protein VJ644_06595 [Jiangellaceae bacterium]|nr:hypothetical protein [Jiangellaceae bacterium]